MLPEEKNLLEEIRATGVEIDDIEELMHMDQNDKALVPIVVKYRQFISRIPNTLHGQKMLGYPC